MKYKFKSIKYFHPEDTLPIYKNTVCFQGVALDDRGEFAQYINKGNNIIIIKYNCNNYSIAINDIEYSIRKELYIEKICEFTHGAASVIIDSTTLNIVDILYILKALNKNKITQEVQILYIEPKEYSFRNNTISQFDDFTLSSAYKEFPPVPGFAIMTVNKEIINEDGEHKNKEEVDLVAFLGFERARLGHIFNSDDGATYSKFIPIIPLPGFNPGWENRTLGNHINFFTPKYNFSTLEYVSANNPYQSYQLLEKISRTRKKFRIAPIGTKPNSIGCAVFLINNIQNPDISVGLLFDFPEKLEKRSKGVGKINIYTLYKD